VSLKIRENYSFDQILMKAGAPESCGVQLSDTPIFIKIGQKL